MASVASGTMDRARVPINSRPSTAPRTGPPRQDDGPGRGGRRPASPERKRNGDERRCADERRVPDQPPGHVEAGEAAVMRDAPCRSRASAPPIDGLQPARLPRHLVNPARESKTAPSERDSPLTEPPHSRCQRPAEGQHAEEMRGPDAETHRYSGQVEPDVASQRGCRQAAIEQAQGGDRGDRPHHGCEAQQHDVVLAENVYQAFSAWNPSQCMDTVRTHYPAFLNASLPLGSTFFCIIVSSRCRRQSTSSKLERGMSIVDIATFELHGPSHCDNERF